MQKLYVVSVDADGGGTDYVLVAAQSEADAREACPNAEDIVELTADWLEAEYGGVAVLGTYEGGGEFGDALGYE